MPMDAATILLLANAAIDLGARLAAEYLNEPDADEAEIAKLNAKLDETVVMVKSKKPIPKPGAPALDP